MTLAAILRRPWSKCNHVFSRALASGGAQESPFKLVYEGKYGKRLRVIKKVSLTSSIISTFLLVKSGVIPLLAQVAMAGTVFFTSVSSTGILQLVSQPYVCSLYASPGPKGMLRATRLSLTGREYETVFSRDDVSKPSSHPFGSCQVRGSGALYVFGDAVSDPQVRALVAKD
eukprot:gene33570-40611_t